MGFALRNCKTIIWEHVESIHLALYMLEDWSCVSSKEGVFSTIGFTISMMALWEEHQGWSRHM